ncbi:EamA family transporter RarD [Aestuariispira insulae]|uniref:Chloramphenicol-sensitive protein RarD n=1 Tax=Aestuariispira insulae TaxID=1461337 RepID=A0A3D9HX53_9PROT|nr:EamA family transporter RarD [Aestuariispira insulae]RED53990.1 chloramphenicol-sensitive protein RarD [Aestuariispira insulae]
MDKISPSAVTGDENRAGLFFGLTAFGIWALFPLYWERLDHVDAVEILAHRALWTAPICALVLAYNRELREAFKVFRQPRTLALLALSMAMISFNWGVYIWSVTHGEVLQASMGYFLNPLVNVLAGLTLFREKLRLGQWFAVGLAATGVVYAGFAFDTFPWIGVSLAVTFGAYGALRKMVTVSAVPGLFVETLLILPFALGYMLWLYQTGTGQFLVGDLSTDLLLLGAGIMTAVPLLCYVAAARRLPISTVGMLFYITPSGLFILATTLYGETVTVSDMITFGFIWAGLILFTFERQRHARRLRETAV